MHRLHPNLVTGIISCLRKIFGDHIYADAAVGQILKSNKKWGGRDRRFIAETVYELVRWWRLLWSSSGNEVSLDNDSLHKLIGFYLAKPVQQCQREWGNRAVRESIPDWLDDMCYRELGNRWEDELTALNREAPVILRANTLKCTREALQQALLLEGITSEPLMTAGVAGISPLDEALVLPERKNVFLSKTFKQGFFEIQDASSQAVGYFLRVKPGMRVIDACAGGGGKSLHLAAIMGNKGRITALDISENKLAELRLRARRAGVHIIDTRVITSTKIIKRLSDSADRVLLDVPCSGLGVLRRNPDAKWKLTPEKIENIKKEQLQIMNQYCRMVKTGGMLVYATCSILPSENELQVRKFLDSRPGHFSLADEKMISPSQHGWDGFYMAALTRNN